MKNPLLILAYILKYAGIAGVLVFMLVLFVSNQFHNSSQMLISIVYIIISVTLFFVGNMWSKKLLRE